MYLFISTLSGVIFCCSISQSGKIDITLPLLISSNHKYYGKLVTAVLMRDSGNLTVVILVIILIVSLKWQITTFECAAASNLMR